MKSPVTPLFDTKFDTNRLLFDSIHPGKSRNIPFRLFVIFLLLTFSINIWASGSKISNSELANSEKGTLWKVEKANQKSSYLLGTVHVSDPRIINFRPELNNVLAKVSSISIEAKLDMEMQMAVAMKMFSPGSNLEADIGPLYFKKITTEMLKYNMTPDMVRQLKPWAVMMTLSVPADNDPAAFMDALIYKYALEKGKDVYGLETLDEQLSIFDSMTQENQITLLKQTVDELSKRDEQLEEMLLIYLDSDLGRLADINESHLKKMDNEILENLMIKLIDGRNKIMLGRMNPRLLEGNALIAVGALHLVGEKGLVNLLRQKGYTLSPVY